MDDGTRAKLEALAYFLVKEIGRHEADIKRAEGDLVKLANLGIEINWNIDPDEWFEVPG